MFKKSPLKSTRLAHRKRKKRVVLLSILVVFLILLPFGLSWLTKLPALAITSIKVEGNSAIDADDLEALASTTMEGNYFYLFSKSNRFLYPKKQITATITDTYKRVESIDVGTDGLHTLVIKITEREPSYVWCPGTPGSGEKSCYFLDSAGYIFSAAPTFSGNAFFSFYGSVTSTDPVGMNYLSSSQFKNLDRFITYLDANNINGYALQAQTNGVYKIYLNKGGQLIFKDNQDILTLESNIDTLLKSTKIFSPKATTSLDYIDLRFGNKIYYK